MVEIHNLKKSFGTHRVLDGLNLSVPQGRTTVILGRSGQGKSVLLKHIIGLIKPDAGEILIDGESITTLADHEVDRVRRKCGLLFQDAALFDSMDVFDNVAFPLLEHTDMGDAAIAAKVTHTLGLVGLKGVEERWPDELSGGMRKRVGLARALVMEPQLMLYDEPTTGLDPITSAQINQLIVDTQRRLQMTALVISHDLLTTRQIADKVVMLEGGRIVEEGEADAFFRTKNPLVQQFLHGSVEGPITEIEGQR